MAFIEYHMPQDDVLLISERLEVERVQAKENLAVSPTGFKK